MSGRLSGLTALTGTGLRGLRSRLLLTVGSVLLAAISVGAAVVGPMYQTGAAQSYLVTKLAAEQPPLTGLVLDYRPEAAAIYPGVVDKALRQARRQAAHKLGDGFEPATLALWTQRLAAIGGAVNLVAAPGACDHLTVVGRCPRKPGEALILKADSLFAHVKVGQEVDVHGVPTPVTIVGTYTPQPFDEHYWFNPADLASAPPQPTGGLGLTPYLPAPFIVSQSTFAHLRPSEWYVRATRRLVITPQTSASDLARATHDVAVLQAAQQLHVGETPGPGSMTPEPGNELPAVARELRLRQDTARSTVAPAVISVILVALVLLLRLLTSAMDLRRSELALASLRGFSRRQMWLLGLIEPVLIVVLAAVAGVVGGIIGGRALASAWLVPGLPMPVGLASALAALAVVVTTLVVSALVVRDALSEPLSAQIAGVRRPTRSSRWGLLLQLVLVAAAVAVLAATLAHTKKSDPDATDLALPILLAVATGLLITLAAQTLARWWAKLTARRRGVFAYLASRTISRRREGTLVILPLTAALAVAIFAAGVFTAAADWRASDAATIVGADRSYSTKLTMDQAVAVTHQIDPAGKWLMAVGAEYTPDGDRLVVDTQRLPRVGVWPASWTPGMSAADIARALAPRQAPVVLTGSRVALTLDNAVSGAFRALTVDLAIQRPNGSQTDVVLGLYRRGTSTDSKPLPGCRAGCELQQVSFGGPGGLPGAMSGTATVEALRVDGAPVTQALALGWRPAQQLLTTPSGVAGRPRIVNGALRVRLASRSANAFAAITPDDVPLVRPVIVGRTARMAVEKRLPGGVLQLHTDASISLDVHPVATAESMPVLGPTGMMIDYRMLTRDVTITNPITVVTILGRSDTPGPVVAALAAHGITDAQTLSSARSLLDQDAFALALKLYLVVTVIVILLALAGLGANLAVQMPSRRRDAASLRVVGLRRRSIVAAVVVEFLVVLGAAALAGIGAGSLSQYVVVRTVTLGYADSIHTPRLLASLNLTSLADLVAVVAAVLFVVSVTVAALTVRGARTASLRENAR